MSKRKPKIKVQTPDLNDQIVILEVNIEKLEKQLKFLNDMLSVFPGNEDLSNAIYLHENLLNEAWEGYSKDFGEVLAGLDM